MNPAIKHISHHGFPPIIDENSNILILGSFPSVKSRAESFYYMHPQNRFWKLLGKLFNENFESITNQQRINLLLRHHIALYDVLESCNIVGSADHTIRNVKPTDVSQLIKETNITKIYINGKTAYHLFIRYNPELSEIAKVLPSTSSANARFRLNDLYNEWKWILK